MKKEKKVYQINVLVFVTLPNIDSDYDDFTFYIESTDKHNAIFQLMKIDLLDIIYNYHNQKVYEKKLSHSYLWDSVLGYEFVDLLSIKVW